MIRRGQMRRAPIAARTTTGAVPTIQIVMIGTSIAWLMAHLTRARSRAEFAILMANVKAARKVSILISSVHRLARRASMVPLSPRREQRRRQTAPMSRPDFYSDPASDMIT